MFPFPVVKRGVPTWPPLLQCVCVCVSVNKISQKLFNQSTSFFLRGGGGAGVGVGGSLSSGPGIK